MYDFLSSKLLPKVYTDTPSVDNYEATNLVSEDYRIRGRGFLAYSTVKPPIDITFELVCPVNIHYIILSTSVGKQKCTCIELLSKKFDESFTSIGYAKYKHSGIVFCNRAFYSIHNLPPNIDTKLYSLNFFKVDSYKSYTAANFIKVRILQTEKSVPCLQKLEIWGKPSNICSVTTLNTVARLMQTTNNDVSIKIPSSSTEIAPTPKEFEFPDEFKDALTFEIMSLPLTLPSGITIDKSSLDKYIANEAAYGRPAADPFTGLPFTDTRRPVLNTALKSRIDMFLVQNSERPETFAIKRTLGRRMSINVNVSPSTKKVKYDEDYEVSQAEPMKNADDFLQESINKIMNSDEFIKFSTLEEVAIPVAHCSKCSISSTMYIVPCDHLYCKNCLLNLSCCIVCNREFSRSDIKIYHN